LPEPPFQRRALAVGHWKSKLVALGGMDSDNMVTERVDFFDIASGEWSKGPDLPGEGMAGFGVSAWNMDGQLYVCGFAGDVYRLSDNGGQWTTIAKLHTPRFFHQLLPAGRDALVAIGGASHEGHLADIEWIDIERDNSSN
jgi:hypothetical protein